MDETKMKELLANIEATVSGVVEKNLDKTVAPLVSKQVKDIVEKMRTQRALFGNDISGLNEDQKKSFAETVKAVVFGKTKANEALIEEIDSRGGYLVSREVAAAVERIAATVGLAMSQVTKWSMSTDELGVPNFTGSFLEGEYLGVDTAGSVTALGFGQASLIAKKWQLAFAVGNDLLADASVNLADWLLAVAAEALANRIDKEVFTGSGLPFVGIFNHAGVQTYSMATSSTTDAFEDFTPADASDVIGMVEESMLPGAAFYFNRTVWAKLRAKNTSGIYLFGGMNANVAVQEKANGLRPAGYILDYPVYTVRHLPANSASAAATAFGIFGNLKAVAYGDKGELRVEQYNSGAFGGKEIALADQKAMVFKHRHAVVLTLPQAFVVIKSGATS